MKPEAIRIDRRWIGAPDTGWNPTVTLFVTVLVGYGLGVAGLLAEIVPVVPGVLWLAVSIYLAFTVMHDAMHGTAHRSKKIGNAMGRVCSLLLMVPFPVFCSIHHAHHGHTNDPLRDPDMLVVAGRAWSRPIRFPLILLIYQWQFYRLRLWRNQSRLREAVLTAVVTLGFFVWAFTAGFAPWVAILWMLPLTIAALALVFAFSYLPHYPHSTQGRYFDTRIYPGRLANIFFLGQNYHLIHHLWTTIPWYRYQAVYASIEGDLRERECAIGWASQAQRPKSSLTPSLVSTSAIL